MAGDDIFTRARSKKLPTRVNLRGRIWEPPLLAGLQAELLPVIRRVVCREEHQVLSSESSRTPSPESARRRSQAPRVPRDIRAKIGRSLSRSLALRQARDDSARVMNISVRVVAMIRIQRATKRGVPPTANIGRNRIRLRRCDTLDRAPRRAALMRN